MRILLKIMVPLLSVAAAGASVVAHAQTPWSNVVAAANKEGSVFLYTTTPPGVVQRIVPDFQNAYPGIKVDINRNVTGALMTKITMEKQSGVDGADVFVSTDIGWYQDRVAENSLLPITGPATAGWPSAYLYGNSVIVGALEPIGIVYNSNLVKFPVTGYKDLLNPELKGRVATSVLNGPTLVAWYDWLEKTQGGDFLNRMAAQQLRMYSGAVTASQGVASGEAAANFFANATSVFPLIEQGAPLKFVVPNPTRGLSYRVAALGWSKRPNAARVLVDYLMSRRGQEVWNSRGDSASPMKGIKGSLDASTFSNYDPKDYPPEVIKAYTEKWNKVFAK